MFLNKLLFKEFGKFNNKEIELSEGLNIVCSDNEAKCSSVREFVVGMLYGINRFKSIGDSEKHYESIKNISGSGASGKAYIKSEGKSYFVERDFGKRRSKVNVLDVASGREFKLKNLDTLYETFVCVDKNTYTNSLVIQNPKASTGAELSREIDEYVCNVTLSGTADIDKNNATMLLKEEMRKYDTRALEREIEGLKEQIETFDGVEDKIKETREKISKVEEEFAIETAKRKREAKRMIETENGVVFEENEAVNEELDKVAESTTYIDKKDEVQEDKLTDKLWVILLTGLFVIGVISAMVYILPFENGVRQLFVICTILFVIITIVEGMYAKGMFEGDVATPSEEDFKRVIKELEDKKTEDDIEIDMSFAQEFVDEKTKLKAIEEELLEDKRRKMALEEELSMSAAKLGVMQKEVHAITLAINTINEISTQIHGNMKDLLADASDIVREVTCDKFSDIRLELSGHVTVMLSGNYRGIDRLPYEDLRLLYIATKLAFARFLCRSKEPVILDNIFVGLNTDTISGILRAAAKIDTDQLILLTTDKLVCDIANEIGMACNVITA